MNINEGEVKTTRIEVTDSCQLKSSTLARGSTFHLAMKLFLFADLHRCSKACGYLAFLESVTHIAKFLLGL